MKKKFFSICIPSYNRPAEIRRLLDSIDTIHFDEVEIVICEDKAPSVKKSVHRYMTLFQKPSMR